VAVDHRTSGIVSVAAGVALGAVDFALQKVLPYPWANLANSAAVWAVAAFALGYWLRTGALRAAIAASVLLVVAVPVYYVTATLVQNDDIANVWAPVSLVWMAFGVLAGVVFGIAGVWARGAGWHRIVGAALPGAVLLAEAARLFRRGDDARWTALIELALGVLVIAMAARTARQRGASLAVAVPLAALGFAGFQLAGFA